MKEESYEILVAVGVAVALVFLAVPVTLLAYKWGVFLSKVIL